MRSGNRVDWILRFVKGIFIGSGFILPGVSGGALAAVFGIYERIIAFLSDIRRDFKKNLLFFIPVGLGMGAGVFALSFAVSYVLGNAETYAMWFFIGCVVGMLPALLRQSAKKGRRPWHLGLMAAVCVAAAVGLKALEANFALDLRGGIFTWLLAGAVIGLGVIVPGLSPSNLLIYMGIYKPMADGIKALDFGVIIPLVVGGLGCVILLSKLVSRIFSKAYAVLYHCILGIVFASTLVIVPLNYNYLSVGGLICALSLAAGALLALLMSGLEDKYKIED